MAGRVRHPIDVAALEKYISQNVPEIQVPLDIKQFSFGQSNPTYQLTSVPTNQRFVLRKKPPGQLLSKTAHQVEREHAIMSALSATDVPVPRTYCLCDSADVLGTPFYVMQFLDGRIIEDPSMSADAVSAAERTQMWRSAVETLAKLHRVDRRTIGLDTFGKADGFYDRQLATWRAICTAQAQARDVDTGVPVGPLPHFDDLLAYLADKSKQPRDRATLIHGDYKIDNLVFHKTEPNIIGILDWEMSTVGHPLSDLANLLNPWTTARMRGQTHNTSAFLPGVTPGLPTPETVMTWYKETAGWDPSPDMNWAMAFSMFRGSAICQGIAARFARRQASSEQANKYAESFAPMAEYAWQLVQNDEKKRNISPSAKL